MKGVYSAPKKSQYETDFTTLSDNTTRIYFSRIGNIVMLICNTVTAAPMNAWVNLAPSMIPERMRPVEQFFCCNCLSGSMPNAPAVGFSIDNSGQFMANSAIPANSAIWITLTYIAKNRD